MNRSLLRMTRPIARAKAGNPEGYRIRNLTATQAEVLIYDEIGYYGVRAEDFVRDLARVDALELLVRINSPGGDVFDGIAIYNALLDHSARVTTRVDGLAASAASFIAMAGEDRVVMRNAQVMIHDAWGMAIGPASEMEKMRDELDQASTNLADIYAARAGGEAADWRAAMLAETWYSHDEAVESGLMTEVYDPGKTEEDEDEREPEMAAKHDLSVFNYAGREKAPAPTLPAAAVAEENTDTTDFDALVKSLSALKEAW